MTDKTDTKKQIAAAKPAPPLKRRGNLVYAANPFMEGEQRPNIKPRLKRITNRKGDMLVMGETGEIVNPVAGFWQSQEVDSAKFVKLFVNGVKAFRELTNAGARVFEALYMEMQTNIGRDRVYLSASSLAEGIQISESTFARGIRELIDKIHSAEHPCFLVLAQSRLRLEWRPYRLRQGVPPGRSRKRHPWPSARGFALR